MESNQAALAIVDGAFLDLERRIAELDQLTDRQQTSRERLAEIDGEISQIKNDADSLDRTKRASRLTALNSSKEIAQSDDSRLIAAIVTARGRALTAGRAVRNLISQVLQQLYQIRKSNAAALLEREFVVRKIPVRVADMANNAKGCVEIRELEALLTHPLHNQAEELGALFVLKVKFEPIRAGVLSEENFVLKLQTAEEPAVAEPATSELEPALA